MAKKSLRCFHASLDLKAGYVNLVEIPNPVNAPQFWQHVIREADLRGGAHLECAYLGIPYTDQVDLRGAP